MSIKYKYTCIHTQTKINWEVDNHKTHDSREKLPKLKNKMNEQLILEDVNKTKAQIQLITSQKQTISSMR